MVSRSPFSRSSLRLRRVSTLGLLLLLLLPLSLFCHVLMAVAILCSVCRNRFQVLAVSPVPCVQPSFRLVLPKIS